MSLPATASPPESALYRRVWRWHFYAGLICLPFLAMLAVTGALYLFKVPIESVLYERLQFVPVLTSSSDAWTPPSLDAETLVAKARAAVPGEPIRFVAPERPGRSAEVGLRTAEGKVSVYLDPGSGEVLGQLRDESKLMELVKHIHSLAIAGTVANHWIEIVAGWAIVLVVSGLFLWWPRGRSGGVYSVRGRPSQRTWWRDLHAVVGVLAAVAVLFLAVTGMPWSAFWGEQFGRLTHAWGIGLPKYLWERPSSTPLASLGEVPWALRQSSLPSSTLPPSDPHAAHGTQAGGGMPAHVDLALAASNAVPPSVSTAAESERTLPPLPAGSTSIGTAAHSLPDEAHTAAPALGLNEALRRFADLGLPPGVAVSLPQGPTGVYTASLFPDDVRGQRVVHLDRYSGAVLADVGYPQYGIAGRVTEWGISLHTGRQFGWANQLVMLVACLAIVLLAVSSAVMWWKRRPRGRLAAPPHREGERAAWGAVGVAALLGLLYPLLGLSMLAALLVDALVPQRWHARFGL